MDVQDWNIRIFLASAPSLIAMLLFLLFLLIFAYFIERNDREQQLLSASQAVVRESEKRYRKLFESTGTAMIVLEEDMSISLANNEFSKLTGLTPEDIAGQDLPEGFRTHRRS